MKFVCEFPCAVLVREGEVVFPVDFPVVAAALLLKSNIVDDSGVAVVFFLVVVPAVVFDFDVSERVELDESTITLPVLFSVRAVLVLLLTIVGDSVGFVLYEVVGVGVGVAVVSEPMLWHSCCGPTPAR